ncbi:hypothetical protein SAMN05421543_112114 [Alicyclobacillus macrosporangiidus]|uniref:Uncharacterized protein n=2 Tax=Alicyclobacillus macrosporangiidus TaxID=392015 RepID=A0A1I7JYE7_9BACL|nr:hypothetical protein SAMN05421543_112114 [Alicyclobacillus macrosporangiidus]
MVTGHSGIHMMIREAAHRFVKVYRYRLRPNAWNDYVTIQAQAAEVYRQFVDYRAIYLRSNQDSSEIIELNFFPDEESYHAAIESVNQEPLIHSLFAKFKEVMAEGTEIDEQEYTQVLLHLSSGSV